MGWGERTVDDERSVLRGVHHGAQMHCRGPSLSTLRRKTVACTSRMTRFYGIITRINKHIIAIGRKRSIGTLIHGLCPSTGHVTSGLGGVAYTAFRPSSIRTSTSLSNASLTMMSKHVKIYRGNTI